MSVSTVPSTPAAARGRSLARTAGLLLSLVLVTSGCLVDRVGPVVSAAPDPDVPVIGCDRAGDHLVLTSSAQLDPACDYTGGIEISTSGVELDCRGADVVAPATNPWPWGVLVHADASVALHDVTVRNCVVSGFDTNIMVRRNGAEALDEANQYDTPFADIVVEDNRVLDAVRDGVYLEWGVTGTTVRRNEIAGSAAVGLYISPGDTGNVVEENRIHHNGFGDVRPEGIPFDLGGTTFRYLGTGREGIAVDGGWGNVIRRNEIWSNASGGIFLYRNCGEYSTVNRRWWGADENQIVENVIADEPYGVWIASRQAENQWFMECADPAYVEALFRKVHLDHAEGTVVRGNGFVGVATGVRIEDDRTTVEGNTFLSSRASDQAVVIGTQLRTEVLGQPVDGTVLRGNRAEITGNPTPYVWDFGHTGTIDESNTSGGAPAALAEGSAPALGPFVFVARVWI